MIFLGGMIFMLKFNGAFLRPPIPRGIIGPVHESKAKTVKYVDDGTVAVGINLERDQESGRPRKVEPHCLQFLLGFWVASRFPT